MATYKGLDGLIGTAFEVVAGGVTYTSGVTSLDDTTDSSSVVTGSLHTDGGLGVAKKSFFGNQMDLTIAVLGAGAIGYNVGVTVNNPHNESGMAAYLQANITGTTAGHCYGLGSWINTSGVLPVLSAGHIIVPFEGGVYAGEAQAAARIVFAGQHQAILAGAPTSLHAWRLNVGIEGGAITALIAAANPGSVGYAANANVASTKIGDIPLADIVGPGVVYVRIYDAPG